MSAKGFVFFIVAVDGGDFGQTFEVFGGFFVGGFEVLAVTAPWRIEPISIRIDVNLREWDMGWMGCVLYNLEVHSLATA